MTKFQKIMIFLLGVTLVLTAIWLSVYLKQHTFNNCKWLFEKKSFTEEGRKKPDVENTYQKCRAVILNP